MDVSKKAGKKGKKESEVGYYRRDQPTTLSDSVEFTAIYELLEKVEWGTLLFFGALFFVSFMLIGAYVIMNLFIGVIMSSMDESQKEQALDRRLAIMEDSECGTGTLESDILKLQAQLEDIQGVIEVLHHRVTHPDEQSEG